MKMKMYFVLGAEDPEMNMIENVLKNNMIPFTYAKVNGIRCHSGNAYKADAVLIPAGFEAVRVECEPQGFHGKVIDHHRPNDSGFGMDASQYWEASSIGQVFKLLGMSATQAARVCAAKDHCFPAAINGQCPGVCRAEVIGAKLGELAQVTGKTPVELALLLSQAQERLKSFPKIDFNGQQVVDMRGAPHIDNPCSALATMLENATVLLTLVEMGSDRKTPTGRVKITIAGNATAESVDYFINKWAPLQCLKEIYGVPARGYAGGYL